MTTLTRTARLALTAATIMLALGGTAQAATQSSTIRITVRRPVTITLLRDLDFGRIVATATSGTVTVDPDTGTRSVSGGPVLAGGTPQTARFRIAATPATLVLITRNALPVLTRAGGGATMPVTLITMSGAVNPVTAPASGVFDIDIGGALSVGANQTDGAYSGTFQINADYQ
jgi:spore coat protein U-like protein